MKHNRLRTLWTSGLRAMMVGAMALMALSVSMPAQAATCTITSPATVSFDTVAVPDSLPVGAEIKTVRIAVTTTCPQSNGRWMLGTYSSALKPSPVADDTLETGVTGIGIKLLLDGYPAVGGLAHAKANNVPNGTSQHQYTITLVKTGASVATGASLDIPTLLGLFATDQKNPTVQQYVALSATRIGSPTCNVTTPSINVTLPPVAATALRSPASVAATTPFSIDLKCSAGKALYVTLSDLTTPGNTSSNLTLTGDSTAKGVQLQIRKSDGKPVTYGQDSPAPGNPGQWRVGATRDGTVTIPLTVQYISTGNVQPGTVEGMATFTLSYQ